MNPANRPYSLNCFDEIEARRTALLVIDMQVAFLTEGYAGHVVGALEILPRINSLADTLRRLGGLVVYTRHTVVDDPTRAPPAWQTARPELQGYFASLHAGHPGHELHPGLIVGSNDLVIDKVRYSAFLPLSSNIDREVRDRGIDTVIVAGTITNICCEASARDAHMLGYRVFVVADATAAQTDYAHNASLYTLGTVFADVRYTDEIAALLLSERFGRVNFGVDARHT